MKKQYKPFGMSELVTLKVEKASMQAKFKLLAFIIVKNDNIV